MKKHRIRFCISVILLVVMTFGSVCSVYAAQTETPAAPAAEESKAEVPAEESVAEPVQEMLADAAQDTLNYIADPAAEAAQTVEPQEQTAPAEAASGESTVTEPVSEETQEPAAEEAPAEETEEPVEGEETEEEETEEEKELTLEEQIEEMGLLAALDEGLLETFAVSSSKVYTFRSAINRDYVLDVSGANVSDGTKVQLYTGNGTDAQKYLMTTNSDGTVTIKNYISGKALAPKENGTSNETPIVLASSDGSKIQKFRMAKNSDGTVTFVHVSSGKVLDVSGGKAQNSRRVQLYTSNGTKAQKWIVEEKAETRKDYSGKTWLIRTKLNDTSVLDVNGASSANKANVQIYQTNGTAAQSFKFEQVGGYYRIINANSGKVLDVNGAKSANGTNVHQYEWNGTKAQLWKIITNSDGSVTFLSAVGSNKVLDVSGAKSTNKTNVQIYTSNGTKAQKFLIVDRSTDDLAIEASKPKTTKATTGKRASDPANLKVLVNIIGAVESGGQRYGNQNYGICQNPRLGGEVTVTLGWACNYGYNAKKLVQMIFDRDKEAFRKIDKELDGKTKDTTKIETMLSVDWVKTKWKASDEQLAVLKKLITSPVGKQVQDDLCIADLKTYISACESTYTKDVEAVMMYCEIRHLGGSAVNRIFTRCDGDYSLDSIMASLEEDQLDTSNNNQVGDQIYWSRHVACKKFIEQYAVL